MLRHSLADEYHLYETNLNLKKKKRNDALTFSGDDDDDGGNKSVLKISFKILSYSASVVTDIASIHRILIRSRFGVLFWLKRNYKTRHIFLINNSLYIYLFTTNITHILGSLLIIIIYHEQISQDALKKKRTI